jgi:Flp pilus assembly protein TadG
LGILSAYTRIGKLAIVIRKGHNIMIMKFPSLLSRLGKDEHASILVQATIYIIVLLGMTGLALDGGRFLLLNNSLQDLADAAALAGAAQLDGAQDAQTRATNAAQAIANKNPPHSWYYDTGGSTTITTTFYTSLKPDRPVGGTTDPKVSTYIEVTTASSQTAPMFVRAVSVFTGSSIANNSTRATAMAYGFGNNVGSCGPVQSFFCSPFEGTETNPGNASNFASNISVGQMVHLVNGANASGNWGLLQPPTGNNNPQSQSPFWAENSAGGCITGPTLGQTRTGDVAKFAQAGMNVRFDSPIGSGDQSLSAPIVIAGFNPGGSGNNCQHFGKGYPETCGPSTCVITGSGTRAYPAGFDPTQYSVTCNSATPTTSSCPLPRDQTFTDLSTGNAAWSNLLLGGGTSDPTFCCHNGGNPTATPPVSNLNAYWYNHHGTLNLPSGVNTRWTAYQCEAGAGAFVGVAGCPPSWQTDSVEPHAPACTNSTTGDYTRRVIGVAVVDCNYWGITGHSTPIPGVTFIAQFFITEPALDDGSIFAEYIGCYSSSPVNVAGCNGSNTSGIPNGLHSLVQLVR